MNYRLCTGCFKGNVVADGISVLDIPYDLLDSVIKQRIVAYVESNLGSKYMKVNNGKNFVKMGSIGVFADMDNLKEAYEDSWERYPTEDEIDLLPASQW